MKNFRFLSFWLLLTVGMATVVFNSCGKDDDSDNSGGSNNPNNPGIGPVTSTTDPGVVINGIRWATRNVDRPGTFTDKPEDLGMFYQWNAKIGWSSTDPLINSNGGTTWMSSWTGNGVSSCEKSNNPCPAGWRMPNQEELQKLIDAGSVWTTNGRLFGSMLGDGSNTLFLPAAGYRSSNGDLLYSAGSGSYYWSNRTGDTSIMGFNNNGAGVGDSFGKAFGFSCRCVAE